LPRMNETTANLAETIRQRLEAKLTAIRSNMDLSQQGRRRLIAAAYKDAAGKLSDLSENFDRTASLTAEQTARDLFGGSYLTGADAISQRDAEDRAAQLENGDQALALLARAQRNGDQHLARAVASVAFERSQHPLTAPTWQPVVQAFADANPGTAAKLQQLADLRRDQTTNGLTNAILLSTPKPSELDGLNDGQIQELADSPDAPSPGWPTPPPARVGDVWQ
jgi:hypothetical protein